MLEQFTINSCLPEDKGYPLNLKRIKGNPSVIYYRGNIHILNQYKNVAVVGSRKASLEGLQLSYQTGRKVAGAGCNLVNGLALGCDTEAVKGALDAGGKCVAILPCGLEQVQPRSNEELAEKILKQGGCILSEYPIETKLQKANYIARDRLQSGVSEGVIIIEAQRESGTMHTADFAERQGRRVACYATKMLERFSGNHFLVESGRAQILSGENDLKEFLNGILQEHAFEQMTLPF